MSKEEIQKRFSKPVESDCPEKQRIREKLAEDTLKFLENNGIIKKINQGVTSNFSDVGTPIPLLKDYQGAQTRNYMKRRAEAEKARLSGSKKGGRKPKNV